MSYLKLYIEAKKRQALCKAKEEKKSFYSELLQEIFTVEYNGDIVFDNNIKYSKSELNTIEKLDENTKKQIHLYKKVFGGDIIT